MIEAIFPRNPIEPWHAIFVLADSEESKQLSGEHLAYRAASNYGSDIINMGFSKYYSIVSGFNHDDNQFQVHCIPHDKSEFVMSDYRLKLKLDSK